MTTTSDDIIRAPRRDAGEASTVIEIEKDTTHLDTMIEVEAGVVNGAAVDVRRREIMRCRRVERLC